MALSYVFRGGAVCFSFFLGTLGFLYCSWLFCFGLCPFGNKFLLIQKKRYNLLLIFFFFFVFVEVKRFYKFDLYINLTLQLFYYFTTPFYADFESPFPS